uniref:Uncharacterized protein n=1 Tax=Stegastes partitus TaxID=144197 RepID=A0A3B5AGY2_9TELE
MSGRVGDLSPKQADILSQFRGGIQDILPSLPAQHDHYLLRWLRGETCSRRHSPKPGQAAATKLSTIFRSTNIVSGLVVHTPGLFCHLCMSHVA